MALYAFQMVKYIYLLVFVLVPALFNHPTSPPRNVPNFDFCNTKSSKDEIHIFFHLLPSWLLDL